MPGSSAPAGHVRRESASQESSPLLWHVGVAEIATELGLSMHEMLKALYSHAGADIQPR